MPAFHRAGCDFAISYASMGANTIFNPLKRSDILMAAEGLHVLTVAVPRPLEDKTIAESSIRQDTKCSIMAVTADGQTMINPAPNYRLPQGGERLLIGTVEAENQFLSQIGQRESS